MKMLDQEIEMSYKVLYKGLSNLKADHYLKDHGITYIDDYIKALKNEITKNITSYEGGEFDKIRKAMNRLELLTSEKNNGVKIVVVSDRGINTIRGGELLDLYNIIKAM